MIPSTQDITFGVAAQPLILDCEDGPITSVTSVTVYEAYSDDTATAESATTGAASVDAVSTTTTAAAGAGQTDPTLIALTSATGVAVDRVYRIAALGLSEDVEIVSINGLNVYARNPLANAYATGATFKAMRATIVVDTTWASAIENMSATFGPSPRYRARWLAVAAGESRVYDRYFDLVRYPSRHGVTPSMLETRFPRWLDTLPTDHRADQGRGLIARAFNCVKIDLYRDGKADTEIRDAMVMAEIVMCRVRLLGFEDKIEGGGDVTADAYKVAKDRYAGLYAGIIRAPFVAVDPTGGGGATARNKPRALWER